MFDPSCSHYNSNTFNVILPNVPYSFLVFKTTIVDNLSLQSCVHSQSLQIYLFCSNLFFFPSGAEALQFLRTQPQFERMRRLVQQNPTLLPTIISQIGQTNPQLLRVCMNIVWVKGPI